MKRISKFRVVIPKKSSIQSWKTGGFKTENRNKSIIFALLIVALLITSTGFAAAKEATIVVKSADTSANRVAIFSAFSPEKIEIHSGENVTWINFKKPKASVVLVSADELWEETTLNYGKAFSFTFENPGTYSFTLKDNPDIKGTVTVLAGESQKTSSEKSVGTTVTAEKAQVQSKPESSMKNLEITNKENVNHEEKIAIYSTTLTPNLLEIEKGDTVSWVNYKKPKGSSVLVSEDSLWEKQTLNYGKAFSYTFEDSGTYTFSLEGVPEAKATVVVK
uniref:EfeO-type cupredoxin-like domain-containing protein n=1 Tax=Methanosarcina barkeri (strain Fusaro / DSM 804) TaxID=269797 RepID=Q46BR6_METBF